MCRICAKEIHASFTSKEQASWIIFLSIISCFLLLMLKTHLERMGIAVSLKSQEPLFL